MLTRVSAFFFFEKIVLSTGAARKCLQIYSQTSITTCFSTTTKYIYIYIYTYIYIIYIYILLLFFLFPTNCTYAPNPWHLPMKCISGNPSPTQSQSQHLPAWTPTNPVTMDTGQTYIPKFPHVGMDAIECYCDVLFLKTTQRCIAGRLKLIWPKCYYDLCGSQMDGNSAWSRTCVNVSRCTN